MELSQLLTNEEENQWSSKALKWVCFVISRYELWESSPSFAVIVRSLPPLLNHALQGVKRTSMTYYMREEVAESLLSTFKVRNENRQSVLSTIAEFVGGNSPLHVQADLALNRAFIPPWGKLRSL